MKTIQTIATTILAVFLVLAPATVFAASTITVATGSTSYNGTATVGVTGTVTPTPTVASNVVLTTTNPTNTVVDVNSVPVSQSTGTYQYNFVAGGTPAWVSGTYTIVAVWAGGGSNATATTTFTYTTNTVQTGVANSATVVASSPLLPGQSVTVVVWSNGPGTAAASYYAPGASSATTLGSPTKLAGVSFAYSFTATLPANSVE